MLSQTEASYLIDSFKTTKNGTQPITKTVAATAAAAAATTTATSSSSSSSSSRKDKIVRIDGRDNFKFRPIELTNKFSNFSNSSCKAKLKTSSSKIFNEVMVGIKVEIEEREFEKFGCGRLEVSVEFTPNALVVLKNDPSQELKGFLNSIYSPLSASNQFKISSIHSLSIFIDIIVLNCSAGNLFDLINLGIRSALLNLKIPKTQEISYKSKEEKEKRAKSKSIVNDCGKKDDRIIKVDDENDDLMNEDVGIKGLLRNDNPKNKTKNNYLNDHNSKRVFVDFELVNESVDGIDQGESLKNLEEIPFVISFNILEDQIFLDATLEEELISNNKLILSYKKFDDDDERIELVNLFQSGNRSEIGFEKLKLLIKEGAKVIKELSKHV